MMMSFEKEWPRLESFIDRIINRVEGLDNTSFTADEIMSHYTTVYKLCCAKTDDGAAPLLYGKCQEVIKQYINLKVLPCLREKKDEILLSELHKRWTHHKDFTKWLSRIFQYLDRRNRHRMILDIQETSFLYFYYKVCGEINEQVFDAMLFMINREHKGEEIDRSLVYNAYAMYCEIGDISMESNMNGFTKKMVEHNDEVLLATSAYFKDNKPKEENPMVSWKKIYVESCDGVVHEVDYSIALVSPTLEDLLIMKANKPTCGEDDDGTVKIRLLCVSSKILSKVIEYCKKHSEDDEGNSILKKKYDDDLFFEGIDQKTQLDMLMAAKYLKIKGLLHASANKIKGTSIP